MTALGFNDLVVWHLCSRVCRRNGLHSLSGISHRSYGSTWELQVKEQKGILIWERQMCKPENLLRFKALIERSGVENKNGAKLKVLTTEVKQNHIWQNQQDACELRNRELIGFSCYYSFKLRIMMTHIRSSRNGCWMNKLINEKLMVEPKRDCLGPSQS